MAALSCSRKYKLFRSPKRGMALILIIGMLAVIVAVSYSLMRSQIQTTRLQTNTETNNVARQAAAAGLNLAIRKMSDDTWGGVGTKHTGKFDSQSAFSVTYTAGDVSLSPGDANYGEYPFRVTVTSTGTAWSDGDSSLSTTYTMTAVLQLVRRALNSSTTPSLWASMNGYTCYQWNSSSTIATVNVDAPIQFQGATCFLGNLKFQTLSIDPTTLNSISREEYLDGLAQKYSHTGVDNRHFTSDVTLAAGRQDPSISDDIKSLAVNVNWTSPNSLAPVGYNNAPSTYTLYAGGPTYTVPSLVSAYGSTPTGQIIGANTADNPLGFYKAGATLSLKSGTKFTGVLFSDAVNDELQLDGYGVEVNGLNLPALHGNSTVYQLPAAMIRNRLVIKNNSNSQVRGLVMNWTNFVIDPGSQNTTFDLQGRLFTEDLDIAARTEWTAVSQLNWSLQFGLFKVQNLLTAKFFPDWMEQSTFNLHSRPRIKFQPPSGVSYHWPDWSQPIYTRAAGDVGLRWNIVSWKDGS